MNWLDIVLLSVIALSVLVSLLRGLIKEVMGLVVWAAAFWVALRWVDLGEAMVPQAVDLPTARIAIGFAFLFLATLLLGGIINYLIGRLVQSTGLTGTDRMLGMFFGLARALLLIVAVIVFARFTPMPAEPFWRQSILMPSFERLADWSAQFLPESVAAYLDLPPVPQGVGMGLGDGAEPALGSG